MANAFENSLIYLKREVVMLHTWMLEYLKDKQTTIKNKWDCGTLSRAASTYTSESPPPPVVAF